MGKSSMRSDSGAKKERKFEKKVQFYTKVKDTVAGLSANKVIGKKKKLRSRQKKLKAYDLSALAEFLPDVSTSKKRAPTNLKLNSKRRQQLVVTEATQLKAVLDDPSFQSDPFGYIHQRLASTQPDMGENPEKISKEKKKKSKGKKSKKSKPDHEAMEF